MHLPLFRPHCLARVAVVRGRECFLIVVLWPKRHVRALGGLTQMRWGPADCSAAVGGCLCYSFSVDFWSGFEVAHFRSSLLLFKKGEGRKRGWRGGGGVERSSTCQMAARPRQWRSASHSRGPTIEPPSPPPPHQITHI